MLPKRFHRYGLTLHPEKTKLIRFKPPQRFNRKGGSGKRGSRETFDFLGFTHYWARSRRGYWVVKKKTAKDRFRRTLKRIAAWCRDNRHLSIPEQQEALNSKLQGHYAYFGVTGNRRALDNMLLEVERVWRKWLGRRSQRGRMPWVKFFRLLKRYPLKRARIIHSFSYRVARL